MKNIFFKTCIISCLILLSSCEKYVAGTKKESVIAKITHKENKPSYITQETEYTSMDVGDVHIDIPYTVDVRHPETFWIYVEYRSDIDDKLLEKRIQVDRDYYINHDNGIQVKLLTYDRLEKYDGQ